MSAVIDDHRRALAAFIATAEGLPTAAWNASPSADKWSPAQVSEHLRLSYTTVLAELAGEGGFRIRTKWWQRRLFRLLHLPKILRSGQFPKAVPATREIRPAGGPFDRDQLLPSLRREGEKLNQVVTSGSLPSNAGITHPFLGRLDLVDGVRFLAQHIRHHHAQIIPSP